MKRRLCSVTAVFNWALTASGFSLKRGRYPWVAAQVRISITSNVCNFLNLPIRSPWQIFQLSSWRFKWSLRCRTAFMQSVSNVLRTSNLIVTHSSNRFFNTSSPKSESKVGDNPIVIFGAWSFDLEAFSSVSKSGK